MPLKVTMSSAKYNLYALSEYMKLNNNINNNNNNFRLITN